MQKGTEIWTIVQHSNEEGTLPWAGIYASLEEAKAQVEAELREWGDEEGELSLLHEYPLGNGNQRNLVFEHNTQDTHFHFVQHNA